MKAFTCAEVGKFPGPNGGHVFNTAQVTSVEKTYWEHNSLGAGCQFLVQPHRNNNLRHKSLLGKYLSLYAFHIGIPFASHCNGTVIFQFYRYPLVVLNKESLKE